MRYEYFKIIDPAFVQSILEGNLYMNPLSYFRMLEDGAQKEGNKAQKDPMEGVCGTIPKNRLRQFGFHFSEDLLDAMGDHVTLLSDNYGYNNLFCLYRLKIDDDNKTIQKPSGRGNPKFCVTAKSGANREKFIMGGRRVKRLPPC